MKQKKEHLTDNPATAFPAPADTPGQAQSRSAYAALPEVAATAPWWEDYLALRQETDARGKARWDWRKAVYIAWASLPDSRRWPPTQKELATAVLGLADDRTIRKWRAKDPGLDDRVAGLTSAVLFKHRANVFDALISVAASPEPNAHKDRKLFLELTGDYQPRQAIALTGQNDGPIQVTANFSDLDEDDLEQLINNLQAAVSRRPVSETGQ